MVIHMIDKRDKTVLSNTDRFRGFNEFRCQKN